MLSDQIDLLEAFNAHGVEYLVVGGHAVSVHGTPRATKDLDLWIDGQPKNGEAVFRALASFGAPLGEISVSDFSGDPNTVFQIGVPPHRVDIMQSISGLRFEDAWSRRVGGMVDGRVPVFFISLLQTNWL